MTSDKDLALELQRLSGTLERLKVYSYEAAGALFCSKYGPNHRVDPRQEGVKPRIWDIRTVFPRLTSLEIDGNPDGMERKFLLSDCAALPDSLTHLRIRMPMVILNEDASLSILPRSLRTGDFELPPPLPGFERVFWAGAPPNLESITAIHLNDGAACKDLSYLPHSLTSTVFRCKTARLTLVSLPLSSMRTLPPRFKTLELASITDVETVELIKDVPWTSFLGRHLERIETSTPTRLSYEDVLHLPRTLVYMAGRFGIALKTFQGDSSSIWPPGLAHLDLPGLTLNPIVPLLPRSLTALETMWSSRSPLPGVADVTSITGPLLPRTLESLSLLSVLAETVSLEGELPPYMRKLEFLGQITFDFLPTQLPASLTWLTLKEASPRANEQSFSGLVQLKTLELRKWSWRVWNFLPPSLTCFRLSSPDVAGLRPTNHGEPNLCALLPCTLTHFEINDVNPSATFIVTLLPPPSLRELHCHPTILFQPELIEQLPRRMKVLDIRLFSSTGKTLVSLPPTLTRCNLGLRGLSQERDWPASAITSGNRYTQLHLESYMYPDWRVTQSLQ